MKLHFAIFIWLVGAVANVAASYHPSHGSLRQIGNGETDALSLVVSGDTLPKRHLSDFYGDCTNDDVCDLTNGEYKFYISRVKDDGSCEERCEKESIIADKEVDGFECGKCTDTCPDEMSVCMVNMHGQPTAYWMSKPGDCGHVHCVYTHDIAAKTVSGHVCGLCDYCPIETPICEYNGDGRSAKKVWMTMPDNCASSTCVEVQKIGEMSGKGYECGMCHNSCNLDDSVCGRNGSGAVQKVWMSKNGACDEVQCVDIGKIEEFTKNDYECGLCDDSCPLDGPVCEHNGDGTAKKLWMSTGNDSKCKNECVDLSDVTVFRENQYECGLCSVESDYCPLDGPACEFYPNMSPRKIYMNSMTNNGAACHLDCVEVGKIVEFRSNGFSCGKCPTCPNGMEECDWRDKNLKSYFLTDDGGVDKYCVEEEKVLEEIAKGKVCPNASSSLISAESEPSSIPTFSPSTTPSNSPSATRTSIPTFAPTGTPSDLPSAVPTSVPTVAPTSSTMPSTVPTASPTYSVSPSAAPTKDYYVYTGSNDGSLPGCGDFQGPAPFDDRSNIVIQFLAFGDTPYDGSAISCINAEGQVEKPCTLYDCTKDPPYPNTCTYEGSDFRCLRDHTLPYMKGLSTTAAFAVHIGDFLKGTT